MSVAPHPAGRAGALSTPVFAPAGRSLCSLPLVAPEPWRAPTAFLCPACGGVLMTRSCWIASPAASWPELWCPGSSLRRSAAAFLRSVTPEPGRACPDLWEVTTWRDQPEMDQRLDRAIHYPAGGCRRSVRHAGRWRSRSGPSGYPCGQSEISAPVGGGGAASRRRNSSSVSKRERIRKRTPSGASSENPLPRPGTTSTVRCVCFQYWY